MEKLNPLQGVFEQALLLLGRPSFSPTLFLSPSSPAPICMRVRAHTHTHSYSHAYTLTHTLTRAPHSPTQTDTRTHSLCPYGAQPLGWISLLPPAPSAFLCPSETREIPLSFCPGPRSDNAAEDYWMYCTHTELFSCPLQKQKTEYRRFFTGPPLYLFALFLILLRQKRKGKRKKVKKRPKNN